MKTTLSLLAALLLCGCTTTGQLSTTGAADIKAVTQGGVGLLLDAKPEYLPQLQQASRDLHIAVQAGNVGPSVIGPILNFAGLATVAAEYDRFCQNHAGQAQVILASAAAIDRGLAAALAGYKPPVAPANGLPLPPTVK